MTTRVPFGRTLAMFIVWMLIAHHDADDLAVGCAAAALAAWASHGLMPPGALRPALLPALRLGARVLIQSVVAGVDVAARAMRANMNLRPGILRYRGQLPDAVHRQAFGTVMSVCPGTLPIGGDGHGTQFVHCVDIGQNSPEAMLEEEQVFRRAFPSR